LLLQLSSAAGLPQRLGSALRDDEVRTGVAEGSGGPCGLPAGSRVISSWLSDPETREKPLSEIFHDDQLKAYFVAFRVS